MALPASFTDELRARIPLHAAVGRKVRLARSGKHWKGCCPFHNEKSPSFYVYEDGYHCFGCGAHGDVITFVMQSQGLGFLEAVGQLAAEAGMEVPKASPEAAEAERRRLDVIGVLEAVQQHYQRRLNLPEGRAARDYLSGRGLTEETINRFGLGWAGERGALTAEMLRQGIQSAQLEEAGLLRRDEETGRQFELFGNRVMFPIRNRRGMIISFGGRILGSGQPKYVNGPETPVFSKRRTLYGLDAARGAVRSGATLVVVEGYMDVIAAAQAGFGGAVAPLGTALTAEQMEELWRVSPTPVLCFDGDAAGARAAARVMDLGLPLLTPERSLKFATLPANEDPDSLVRAKGPQAFQAVLDAALSPSDALYDMVRGSAGDSTPEQRAALRSRLIEAAARITDKSLAGEYRRVLLDRFFAASRPARTARTARAGMAAGGAWRLPPPVRFVRTRIDQTTRDTERNRILTAILLRNPSLLLRVDNEYATLALDGALGRIQNALLDPAIQAETLDSKGLMDHLTKSGCERDVAHVLAAGDLPLPGCASSSTTPDEAIDGWRHFFGFLDVEKLREEVQTARAEAETVGTTATVRRLNALVRELRRLESGEPDGVGLLEA